MRKFIGPMALACAVAFVAAHAAEEQVSRLPRVPNPPTDPIVKEMWDQTPSSSPSSPCIITARGF